MPAAAALLGLAAPAVPLPVIVLGFFALRGTRGADSLRGVARVFFTGRAPPALAVVRTLMDESGLTVMEDSGLESPLDGSGGGSISGTSDTTVDAALSRRPDCLAESLSGTGVPPRESDFSVARTELPATVFLRFLRSFSSSGSLTRTVGLALRSLKAISLWGLSLQREGVCSPGKGLGQSGLFIAPSTCGLCVQIFMLAAVGRSCAGNQKLGQLVRCDGPRNFWGRRRGRSGYGGPGA